jgi:hypothetical protein
MADLPRARIGIGQALRLACVAAGLTLVASATGADTLVLKNGDRISGRTSWRSAREIRVQTPYGVLVIPRDKADRIVHDDGSEESLIAPPPAPSAPVPTPTPAPAMAHIKLNLVVRGQVFWQAWDKSSVPPSTSLRLELRIDSETVVAWVDGRLNAGDIPNAAVNSFSFSPEEVTTSTLEGVGLSPADVRPGQIWIELRLPTAYAGVRQITLAYRVNDGTGQAPSWRDLVRSSIHVELLESAPTTLRLEQDRGEMEFSGLMRKRMKKSDTFRIALRRE